MKIIGYTDAHAGQVKVQFGGWGGQRYFEFEGDAPPKNTLVVLELEGLKYRASEQWWDDRLGRTVADWLKEYSYTAIPPALWRKATLDDWLESENAEVWQHSLGQLFTLEDASAFWQRHEAPLANQLKAAVRGRDDQDRERVFRQIEKQLRRLSTMGGSVNMMLQTAQQRLAKRLDTARIKAVREQALANRGTKTLTTEEWAGLFKQLSHPEVLTKAAQQVADDLLASSQEMDALLTALQRLGQVKKFREYVNYNSYFWQKFNGKLELSATETDITIDITQAREQPVQMSFDLLKARRIGRIVPGRTALVVSNDRGLPEIYIRGERKLKLAAQKAPGGKIRRFGCTLAIQQDKKLENFLLDIERIDTLAQLDPLSALPPDADDKLRAVAEAARTDWKQARVLADLLIERQTGVDAEILRRHARNQNRANRR